MAITPYGRIQGHVTDRFGNIIATGATVEIRDETGLALSTLYEDRLGATGKSNPVTADSNGYWYAYAEPGYYQVESSKYGTVTTWRDVEIGGTSAALEAAEDRAGAYAYASELEGEDGTLIDFVGNRVVTFSNETPAKNEITPMATFLTTATRASDGTYVDKDGILQTATTNELRYTHDPFTGQPLGILREEASENLFIKSEDLTHVGWVKTRTTISSNATTAPDGFVTADTVVENTDTNDHRIKRTVTSGIDSTQKISASFWIKAAGRSHAWCLLWGDAAANRTDVNIDLTDGTFSSAFNNAGEGTGGTGKITRWLDGWYHVTLSCTPNTTANTKATLEIRLSDGAATIYTGDGVSGVHLWGVQLEQGEPTSYMATDAATVTRAADTIAGDVSKLDQQGGPVSIAVIGRFSNVLSSANQYIFSMHGVAGVVSNSFLMFKGASGSVTARTYSGSSASAQALNIGTMTDASLDLVLATTFQENSMRGKSSIGVADDETGDPLPIGDMTTMQFGKGGGGGNCTIERVVISNRGWSDTKIARIAASRD